MTIGKGAFRYRVDDRWAHRDAAARGVLCSVACDRRGRVYVCSREPDPKILVYDADGARLDEWTHAAFRHPAGIHGISVTADDTLYVTDVLDHVVHRFTLDGTLLGTLGTAGRPGAPGQPFNSPTQAFQAPSGDLYVADGYGQARIHRFAADGTLLASWGEPGGGPGQFDTPHSIGVDRRGQVWVADRENQRVQVFDGDGGFIRERALERANNIALDGDDHVFAGSGILDLDGTVLAESIDYWGHCVCVAPNGDLYWTHVGGPNQLAKYIRVEERQ